MLYTLTLDDKNIESYFFAANSQCHTPRANLAKGKSHQFLFSKVSAILPQLATLR